MLHVDAIFRLVGAFLLVAAGMDVRERRWSSAAFWTILSMPFLFGDAIIAAAHEGVRWPAQAMGAGLIALGVLAAHGRLRIAEDTAEAAAERRIEGGRVGNRLFVPALAIPALTVVLVLSAPYLRWNGAQLIDAAQATLISLGIACVGALAIGLRVTGAPFAQGVAEGRRLLDTLGWAALLPMVLATLGSVFAATGVGDAIAAIVSATIPADSRAACLVAFALGMVVFTVIMGNAFAAFPVMMAGVGLPLLVLRQGADPAALGAMGMLTGYCGTLLTPMAANFNIVPAVLLELPDHYGVIRAQWPTALILLAVNVALMGMLVFR
ncbi:MAG TPA: DUF979 domain-containing protein [Rhodanobacteraceae bacterium]|jgi:uncharacterized membrane protein|nr:DUF979 domain-containing protein [Rhodanobacteraceae bacterium]